MNLWFVARKYDIVLEVDSTELNGPNQITTSSKRMEIEVATVALKWLSNTLFTKSIIVSDSQSTLWEMIPLLHQNKLLCKIWSPPSPSVHIHRFFAIISSTHFQERKVHTKIELFPALKKNSFFLRSLKMWGRPFFLQALQLMKPLGTCIEQLYMLNRGTQKWEIGYVNIKSTMNKGDLVAMNAGVMVLISS